MQHATALTAPATYGTLDPAHQALIGFLARYVDKTHRAYRYHLTNWFSWCATQGLDPLTGPTRAHVELYVRWRMTDLGNGASTIGSVMTPIKGYYRFAVIDGLIDRNPAEYAHVPKIWYDHSSKVGLSRNDLSAWLAASRRVSPRHHALGYLLGINALRISEACQVRVQDYQDTERGHRVLRLVGKGNKPATMPLTVPVLRALDEAAGDRREGLLCTTLDGRPLTRHAAAGMVRTITRRAGITTHVHPHMIRASAITAALDAGVPLRDVQYLARHEDPRTTSHYDRARHNLDRHGVHVLTAFLAGGA